MNVNLRPYIVGSAGECQPQAPQRRVGGWVSTSSPTAWGRRVSVNLQRHSAGSAGECQPPALQKGFGRWVPFHSVGATHSLACTTICYEVPCSGELRTQKLKSHLVRIQSLNVLPLKPGVGHYIAIHATLTARNFFFLAYFYTSGPFTCIFSKTSPDFSLCWLWLTHGSCVGPQNKIGHPAGCRFPCWVPAEYK